MANTNWSNDETGMGEDMFKLKVNSNTTINIFMLPPIQMLQTE